MGAFDKKMNELLEFWNKHTFKITAVIIAPLLLAFVGSLYAQEHTPLGIDSHMKAFSEAREARPGIIPVKMCFGEFAFCGASGAEPTGHQILVNNQFFAEGVAVCPVMTGPSLANMALMNNSCDRPTVEDFPLLATESNKKPEETVWSLFWYFDEVPQAQHNWETWPTRNRKVTIGDGTLETRGMSNMWSFPCVVEPELTDNGVKLSKCYGPLMEGVFPFRGSYRVKPGQISITQAPYGAPYPVGTVIPPADGYFNKDGEFEYDYNN